MSSAGFPVICLINYQMAWQMGYKRIKRKRGGEEVYISEKLDTTMFDLDWDAGILDESTTIKTPGSKVSKFFRIKLAPKVKHRLVMTGSAYTKRPLDVWAQVNYACGAEVFPRTYGPFKSLYAIDNPNIRGAIAGYQNISDMVWRLSQVAILLKKEDMFDLPPAVHETRKLTLCPKSQKLYTQLKDDLYVELEMIEERGAAWKKLNKQLNAMDEESAEALEVMRAMTKLEEAGPVTITAEHVFSRIRKWMQITSGFIYPDPTEVDANDRPVKPDPIDLGTEKLDELASLLELRAGKPTVIVTQFDHEEELIVAMIRKKFHFIPKVLNGSVTRAEVRHQMIKDAAKDPAFIIKQKVGARGIDTRWADMLIFFSHDYDTEFYEQMLSRNHRGGQTKSITYMHLVCSKTIDERVIGCLQKDLDLAASIEHDWRGLFD